MINRGEGNSDKFTDLGELNPRHGDKNEMNSIPSLKKTESRAGKSRVIDQDEIEVKILEENMIHRGK